MTQKISRSVETLDELRQFVAMADACNAWGGALVTAKITIGGKVKELTVSIDEGSAQR